jgi:hypothetical protein
MTWPSCCSYRRARCRKDRAVLEEQNQQCCESEPYIRAFVRLQRASRSKLAADDLGHIPANAREHPTRSRRPVISHGRARSSGSLGGVRSQSKSVLRVRVFGGEQDQVDRLLTPVPLRSQANAMPPARDASARRSAESDSAVCRNTPWRRKADCLAYCRWSPWKRRPIPREPSVGFDAVRGLPRVVSNSELKVGFGTHRVAAGKQPIRVIVSHSNVCQCHLNEVRIGVNSGTLLRPRHNCFRHSPPERSPFVLRATGPLSLQ